MKRVLRLTLFVLALSTPLFHLLAGNSWGNLHILYLVDRSGSMWAPMGGTPKTALVADGLQSVCADLPPDAAVGLRVYPVPGAAGEDASQDPGLRIPVRTGNRHLFPEELARMNPRGRAALAEHLLRAFGDFPDTNRGKLLILITDGADTDGESFCAGPLFADPPQAVRLHIFTLNMQDPSEREELNCLSRQIPGSVTHLDPGDSLGEKLLALTREAYREEARREARLLEEQRRLEALRSKTRLQVSFQNTLDPFFADSLEVVGLRINGRDTLQEPFPNVASGQRLAVFEGPVSEGVHKIELQYRMRRGGGTISSRTGSIEVRVDEGKTARVLAVPRSALFHWGCALRSLDP